MDAAIFGLAGVVIGAVLTWLGTIWSEQRRRQHEGRMLIRAEKLQAYLTFAAGAKRYMAVLYQVGSWRKIDPQTEQLTLADAEPLLAEAYRIRDQAFETIRLLGSEESIESARAWVTRIYDMRNYLDSAEVTMAGWHDLQETANSARSDFYRQARTELGIA